MQTGVWTVAAVASLLVSVSIINLKCDHVCISQTDKKWTLKQQVRSGVQFVFSFHVLKVSQVLFCWEKKPLT